MKKKIKNLIEYFTPNTEDEKDFAIYVCLYSAVIMFILLLFPILSKLL